MILNTFDKLPDSKRDSNKRESSGTRKRLSSAGASPFAVLDLVNLLKHEIVTLVHYTKEI